MILMCPGPEFIYCIIQQDSLSKCCWTFKLFRGVSRGVASVVDSVWDSGCPITIYVIWIVVNSRLRQIVCFIFQKTSRNTGQPEHSNTYPPGSVPLSFSAACSTYIRRAHSSTD